MSKTDPSSPLTAARAALKADRPGDALSILRPLVEARPNSAEVQLQLALTHAAAEDIDAARAAFAQARALAPSEPVIWLEETLFEAARGQGGRMAKAARKASLSKLLTTMVLAAATGQGAVAVGTGSASRADIDRLAKAAAARDLATAERLAAPMLRAGVGAVVWGLLGQVRLDAGRAAAAAEAFRQGVRLEPYAVDLRLGLGRASVAQSDLKGALGQFRRATQLAPRLATAWLAYGRLVLQAGLPDRALAAADRVLAQAPRTDGARSLAAEAALALGQLDRAIAEAEARKPGAPGRALLLAEALRARGRREAAVDVLSRHLTTDPNDGVARLTRGQMRQSTGDAAGAEADLRGALTDAPTSGTAARALAYGTRLAADDPAVAAMRAALARRDLRPEDRRAFDYALARTLQGSDASAAAAHLAQANAAMLKAFPYNPSQMRQEFERSSGPLWSALQAAQSEGATSACAGAPIFVTGLPRSGTTGGMKMITWPNDPQPIPGMKYGDEVMTGFEYGAAATMIQNGLIHEGLMVAKVIHDRYDGRLRTEGVSKVRNGPWGYSGNPFGDDECGKFYGRSLSVWSLLLALQGYIYDGPAGRIGFKPVLHAEDHASFFTTAEGYGLFTQKRADARLGASLKLLGGRLMAKLTLSEGQAVLREVVLNPDLGGRAKSAGVTLAGQPIEATLEVTSTVEVTLRFADAIVLEAGQTLAIEVS